MQGEATGVKVIGSTALSADNANAKVMDATPGYAIN